MAEKTLLATGDIMLGGPDPDSLFDLARETLQSADVAVAHVESVMVEGMEGRDPKKLGALKSAGFDVASMAANHVFDQGVAGIRDTIAALRSFDIEPFGAGMNIAEARTPAIVERDGTRFGFLSYNCVGSDGHSPHSYYDPKQQWAFHNKPGGAYVHVLTHYVLDYASPGGTPVAYTGAEATSLLAMVDDIEQLRAQVDVLSVSFHTGTLHTRATVEAYQRQIGHAAIDAGADVIVSHHAHICRGIEIYKGKPIYHGLGNFIVGGGGGGLALPRTGPVDPTSWAARRVKIFNFEAPEDVPGYSFHPESLNTMIAKCTVDGSGEVRASYIPVYINKQKQPEVLGQDELGQRVFDYIKAITEEAGLNTTYEWDGNEVAIAAG